MLEEKFYIPNITCGHCVHTIKMEVGELPGVTRVDASAATKEVTVEFGPPTTSDQIVDLLQEIHYAPA